MKKGSKFLAPVLAFALALSLAACSSGTTSSTPGTDTSGSMNSSESSASETPSGSKMKIGVCIYKYDDTYMSSVRQAMEAAFGSDAETVMNDSQGDQGKQNDQIDVMIQQKVNALAINIVDIGAAQTVLDKAKDANLPIVFFNREPATDIIKSYDKARFVGTTASEAGVIQGQIILDMVKANPALDKNGDGKLQYVMLMGEADNPEAIARTEHSIKTITEGGYECVKIGDKIANWSSDEAKTAMDAWLAKDAENIEFVICNNDGMASGAVAALNAIGYNTGEEGAKMIPVIGVDATDEAVSLIESGKMSGSVKQDAEGMAKAVVALSENMAAGKDPLEGTGYQYDETGIAVRIPYQAYTAQ